MGNTEIIRNGDVQVMSAEQVKHSEFNQTMIKELNCCRFGFSNQQNIEPIPTNFFESEERKNKLQQILSPNAEDEGVWIHQDAWFHLVNLTKE
jgi:redox-sensitive bicupin YhaK (pirin superfamily)